LLEQLLELLELLLELKPRAPDNPRRVAVTGRLDEDDRQTLEAVVHELLVRSLRGPVLLLVRLLLLGIAVSRGHASAEVIHVYISTHS